MDKSAGARTLLKNTIVVGPLISAGRTRIIVLVFTIVGSGRSSLFVRSQSSATLS